MPYIPQKARPKLERKALGLGGACETVGELNFAITKVIIGYLYQNRVGLSYTAASAVRGVLLDVAGEFYRRVMVPYEEHKRDENGDVYPDWLIWRP